MYHFLLSAMYRNIDDIKWYKFTNDEINEFVDFDKLETIISLKEKLGGGEGK